MTSKCDMINVVVYVHKKGSEQHASTRELGRNLRERIARHRCSNDPNYIPVVERLFGREAVIEYLTYIEDDCQSIVLLGYLRRLGRFVRI